jgi:hypothetical protein
VSAADHPSVRGLACGLCAEPPHRTVRLKQPIGDGMTACPYCDPNLFTPTRRTEK